MAYVGVVIVAYLLGSIPTAYILTRWQKGMDIRCLGDRNAGAANVFRSVGPGVGVLTGVVDTGKGALAVLLARGVGAPTVVVLVAGIAVVVGHNWPMFLRFRGGRGAATAVGVLLALLPKEILALAAVAILPFMLTRNVTVALATVFAPLSFVAWLLREPWPLVGYAVALPVLVGITHFLTTREAPLEACKDAPHPENGKY